MHKFIWVLALLAIINLPNIIALWFDHSSTKLAALLVPILFFLGLSRLFNLSKRNLLILSIPFLILSYMDLVYLLQYNVQTTAGVIDAIIESDMREGIEFAKEAPKLVVAALFVYIAVFVILFIASRKLSRQNKKYSKIVTALLILLPIVDLIGKGASSRSFPLGITRAAFIYTRDTIVANDLLKQRAGFSFNVESNSQNEEQNVNYIFVIGETSRRDYYSLYGFSRDTNPLLSKRKSLAVFTDVVSPSNATIPSLKYMLYMATAENERLFYTSNSIVSLAKEANYKTYWLSSQARYGEFDATSGSTGIEADKKIFINQERSILHVYDGELLTHLKRSLKDQDNKKFIVMHLYGSHFAYDRRYPEAFDIFKGVPQNYAGRSKEIQKKVNNYTNSIVYTDSVLNQAIELASQTKHPSCLVYTSDHGEYLGDLNGDNYTGHGYPIPYKSEVEVPFLVWCSQEYRKQYPQRWANIINNQNLKIKNEDLFYTLADLLQINFKLMKPEQSFFGTNYKTVPKRKVISTSNKIFKYSELK